MRKRSHFSRRSGPLESASSKSEPGEGLPGFYVGRYDVRFGSIEQFVREEAFTILELSGAASEATSAYDSSKSLRELGCRGISMAKILSEWLRHREYSLRHPLAD